MDGSKTRHLPEDITSVLDELQLKVEAICRSLGARRYMEDVVQRVNIKFSRAWPRVRLLGEEEFRRYLWTATRNAIADQIRVSEQSRLELVDPAVLADSVSSNATGVGTDLSMHDLLAMIPNSRQREACRLYFVESLTEAEIAREMGVSTSTVSRLLERARQALRKRLEADDS